MGVNHYARRGCFFQMCHEPWSFRLLLFLCANRIYAQPLLFCLKIAEKQYFLFWNFASFFKPRLIRTSWRHKYQSEFLLLNRFWLIVGSETNIPDDSFGGYEIAPSSQILYLDIQTLQQSWNIFNVRKYKRHNIISHNFIIKNTQYDWMHQRFLELWDSYLWKSFLFIRHLDTPFQ